MSRPNNRILAVVAFVATLYLFHLALRQPADSSNSALSSADATTSGNSKTSKTRTGRPEPIFHKIQKRPPASNVGGGSNNGHDSQSHMAAHGALTDHPLRSTNLDIEFPNVDVNQRGHVLFDPTVHANKHPIRLLIERARKQVEQLDERIKGVKTLQDAVDDYKTTWGMKPPKGIDVWWV